MTAGVALLPPAGAASREAFPVDAASTSRDILASKSAFAASLGAREPVLAARETLPLVVRESTTATAATAASRVVHVTDDDEDETLDLSQVRRRIKMMPW